jgi:hypothetical protein
MSIVLYVALVRGGPPAGYSAVFPDLPGLEVSAGDLGELLVKGREALAARLDEIEGAGEAWPVATPIEAVVAPEGTWAIPVDVSVDDPPTRVNISLGERLLQRLDAAAEARGMTRSGFIAQAVRASLGESTRPAGSHDDMGRRLQDELADIGRKLNESLGPDSAFSRRLNAMDDVVYEGVRKAADSLSAAMARKGAAARREPEGQESAPTS